MGPGHSSAAFCFFFVVEGPIWPLIVVQNMWAFQMSAELAFMLGTSQYCPQPPLLGGWVGGLPGPQAAPK